jgi:3-dehydroquinate dehydratase II
MPGFCYSRMMSTILLLNGPNLGLLGTREPGIYGSATLADIEKQLAGLAQPLGLTLETFQSDAEHELIGRVHAARGRVDFILLNPAALTHTSVALRDALLGIGIPFIEIHLSNVAAREEFRKHSYFSDVAVGTISGFGATSYELALIAAHRHLSRGNARGHS